MDAKSESILRCAVIDDEPLARDLLVSYVERTPFLELSGVYSNAVETLQALNSKNENLDLLFLDIQMPEFNGLELSKMIKNQPQDETGGPRIVFTTAFEQYAIDGYKVDAVDYLLKPISYPEFLQAATKARNIILQTKAAAAGTRKNNSDLLYVKSEYKYIQIKISDIIYVEGLKDYIKIYTKTNTVPVLTLMNLKTIEEKLVSFSFIRVHRSFIINTKEIKVIEKGRILLDNGIFIPIGDSYKNSILELIE